MHLACVHLFKIRTTRGLRVRVMHASKKGLMIQCYYHALNGFMSHAKF